MAALDALNSPNTAHQEDQDHVSHPDMAGAVTATCALIPDDVKKNDVESVQSPSPSALESATPHSPPGISLALNLILAFAGCVAVENNYVLQPILATLRDYFHVQESAAGTLQAMIQGGFAIGMLFYIPAGDVWSKRALIFAQFAVLALGGLALAFTPSTAFPMFQFFCLVVGVGTSVTDIIKPFAMSLSTKDKSGQVLGIILGGFYMGMMVSRILSGVIGQYWIWQALFYINSAVQLATIVLLWFTLPRPPTSPSASAARPPTFTDQFATYTRNVTHVVTQFFTLPAVRHACFMSFCSFAQMNAYLVAVSFLLSSPVYGYPASVIGYLAFASLVSILQAPNTGRMADRFGPYNVVPLGFLVSLCAWTLLVTAGTKNVAAVVVGGILIDLGNQFNHIPQNLRVFRHTQTHPHLSTAGSRLNATYMICVFAGGSVGSAVGSAAWSRWGWTGVCVVGYAVSAVMAGLWCAYGEDGRWRGWGGVARAVRDVVTGRVWWGAGAAKGGKGGEEVVVEERRLSAGKGEDK
ncbi:hypothetical protein HDU93_007198 [Gonapodya sp. JEL0774]|nr:hypothetical protein HDU93_007198 [Gonapodya sp. JEL0774]